VNDDFYAGCAAAKTRLSASDKRRKTEVDYKAGWNAWNPSGLTTSAAAAPAPQPSLIAPPVAAERQGNMAGGGSPDAPATPTPARAAVAQTPGAGAVPTAQTGRHANTRWYVAHFGAETCVPDIDMDTMQRLYYGTGPMKTPEDLVASLAAKGVTLKAVPSLSDGTPLPDGTRLYNESGLMTGSGFALFDDQRRCQALMGMLQK
jgi:hypothetical protein